MDRPSLWLVTSRRLWIFAAIVTLAAIVALTAMAMSMPYRAAAQEPPRDRAVLIQELAERLLAPPYPGPGGQAAGAQLLPGELPAGLPVELPVPPDGRLVGSVVRRTGEQTSSVEAALDAPGKAPDVLAFYERQLTGRGWAPAPTKQPPRGGFQPSVPPPTSAMFCRAANGPWLSVNVFPKLAGPSDVRLRLELSNPGPCAAPRGPEPPRNPPGADLLPPLYAPEGVALSLMSSGGGSNQRWSSEAVAPTAQGVAELEAHFAKQLAAAGWRRVAGRADGPLAWSLWAVPAGAGDGEWQGFLYALDGPGKNRRSFRVQVESATAAPAGVPPFPPPPAAMPALPQPPPPAAVPGAPRPGVRTDVRPVPTSTAAPPLATPTPAGG